MTEEEESLALEEHSLNLEIEHVGGTMSCCYFISHLNFQEESFSIDVELERQVAAEAEALEKFELSQKAAFSTNQVRIFSHSIRKGLSIRGGNIDYGGSSSIY